MLDIIKNFDISDLLTSQSSSIICYCIEFIKKKK